MDKPKSYASRGEIIRIAELREAKLLEEREQLIEKFINAMANERAKMSGMTRLLGLIVERCGEQSFTHAQLEAMHPGRVFVADRDQTWTAKLRDDGDKPPEMSIVPEVIPDEFLDKEAMDRDGVTEVRIEA
jgi:hypothetical protein